MACFEDYEVLSIVGTNLNSTCYKVKNKRTSEIFVWKAINYENYPEQSQGVLNKLAQRKLQQHICLLEFCEHILHEETNTIYLVTEYCKHGSIANIIQKCSKTNERFNEDFIWSLIYNLANFIKTSNKSTERPNIYDTFVDVERNVKLLNFTLSAKAEESTSHIYDLGILLHQIVHLKLTFDPNEHFPEYYSNDLHNLLKFLTHPESDVTPTCDAILCHPTVLHKRTIANKSMLILKNSTQLEDNAGNENVQCPERILQVKFENLRKRDAQMKSLDAKLQERERNLIIREKKITLMERIVKEKMTRAELYLKRARGAKPSIKGKSCYEKNDTSFSADCGDTSIIPTSRKLNMQTLPRPAKFSRTMSERRVRFKSHSPLKEMHNFKHEIRAKRLSDVPELIPNLKGLELIDSDKASQTSEKCAAKPKKKFALSSMFASKKTKKPNSIASSSDSVSVHTYEDLDKGWDDFRHELQDCQPINWTDNARTIEATGQWTQDSKKQAFDLLRLMNQEDVDQIKHTFL